MWAVGIWMAVIAQVDGLQLESKVKTASGLYERFVDPLDERRFQVRWTNLAGESQILVDESERSLTRISRRPEKGLRLTGMDEVVEVDPRSREEKVVGKARRIFFSEFGCQALAFVPSPTALNTHRFSRLKNLNCDGDGRPLLANASVVIENEPRFDLPCYFEVGGFCLWVAERSSRDEAVGQLLSMVSLQKLQSFLTSARLETFLPTLKVKPWAFESNDSYYDSYTQTIYLGTGKVPDSHDGFVIVHEWGHFALDQLNPGVWGYDAEVLHEAIPDYLSTSLWNNPCFAPLDAGEVEGRECIRRVDRDLYYPRDMTWSDAHKDSQVLSVALWEGLRDLSPEIRWSVLAETIISLPKNFEISEFWSAVMSSLERQPGMMSSRGAARNLSEVLRRRGFFE